MTSESTRLRRFRSARKVSREVALRNARLERNLARNTTLEEAAAKVEEVCVERLYGTRFPGTVCVPCKEAARAIRDLKVGS